MWTGEKLLYYTLFYFDGDFIMTTFKKLLICIFLFICISGVSAQQYAWTDSLAASTTSVDTTFSPRWNGCTLWFTGSAGLVKFATSSSDTAGWSDKTWTELAQGQTLGFWQVPYYQCMLYRLEYKSVSATGAVHIVGVKVRYQ